MVNNKDPYPVCLIRKPLGPSTASRCLLICVNSLPAASKPPTCLKMVPECFMLSMDQRSCSLLLGWPGVTLSLLEIQRSFLKTLLSKSKWAPPRHLSQKSGHFLELLLAWSLDPLASDSLLPFYISQFLSAKTLPSPPAIWHSSLGCLSNPPPLSWLLPSGLGYPFSSSLLHSHLPH